MLLMQLADAIVIILDISRLAIHTGHIATLSASRRLASQRH
jgi:hypothetical protein